MQKSMKHLFGHPVSKYWLRPWWGDQKNSEYGGMVVTIIIQEDVLGNGTALIGIETILQGTYWTQTYTNFSFCILSSMIWLVAFASAFHGSSPFGASKDEGGSSFVEAPTNKISVLTLMLLSGKKPEKLLKPWHMGSHLWVLSEGYPMNTNMTGFRWFSKIFVSLWALWTKVTSVLQGLIWHLLHFPLSQYSTTIIEESCQLE